MCAGLAERRVRNDVEPFIANGIAALDTYSEDALLHPTKGGFYGRKLPVSPSSSRTSSL